LLNWIIYAGGTAIKYKVFTTVCRPWPQCAPGNILQMFTDLVKKNVPLGNGEIERKKRERDGEQSIKNID
jgi:hypothetical protein